MEQCCCAIYEPNVPSGLELRRHPGSDRRQPVEAPVELVGGCAL